MNSSPFTQSPWTAGRVFLATLVVAAVLLGFWLFYRLVTIWLLFFAAVILATALTPIVDRLQRMVRSRLLAASLVHLAALILLLGVFITMAPLLVQQAKGLVSDFPQRYSELRDRLQESNHHLLREVGRVLPNAPFRANSLPIEAGPSTAPPLDDVLVVLGGFGTLFWTIFLCFATLLLSIFWNTEGRRIVHSFLLVLPAERREEARHLLGEIQAKLGAFVRGQAILCLLVTLMCIPTYLVIGLPYPLALALLVGTFEAMPVLGPILATFPVVLIGSSLGLAVGLEALVANIVIAQIESYLLVPRVMDRSVGVHPMLTLLAIAALLATVGVLGGLLAIPLAAVLQILFRHFVFVSRAPHTEVPEPNRGPTAILFYRTQELLNDLHQQLRSAETDHPEFDQVEEEVELIVVDLASLLRRHQIQETGV